MDSTKPAPPPPPRPEPQPLRLSAVERSMVSPALAAMVANSRVFDGGNDR